MPQKHGEQFSAYYGPPEGQTNPSLSSPAPKIDFPQNAVRELKDHSVARLPPDKIDKLVVAGKVERKRLRDRSSLASLKALKTF